MRFLSAFLIIILFILSSLVKPAPVEASWQDFLKEQLTQRLDLNGEKIKVLLFSQPDLTQPTYQLRTGQTIYLKLELSGKGDKQRVVRLLDSRKKELTTRVLEQSGKGPYIYQASLPAPLKEGIYYLDIKIESDGFSFVSQENLNVGEIEKAVKAESRVTLIPLPTTAPGELPSFLSQSEKASPLDIVRNWLANLSNFFQSWSQ